MANNNQIYKMSNAGGFKSLARYADMLAGNTVWNPYTPEGSMYEIAKYTVPSGGVASVVFPVPTGYRHLRLESVARSTVSASEDSQVLRFNNDSGSNYSYHFLFGNGSSANASATSSASSIYPWAIPGATFLANSFGASAIDILDYASSVKNKTVRVLAGYDDNSTGGRIAFTSGGWYNTSPITSLTLTNSASYAAGSTFTLIGIK